MDFIYGFNPSYFIIVGPAIIFALWAQFKVKSSFSKYSKQRTANGVTGAEIAREILRSEGLNYVRVEPIGGHLSDHFDPRENVVRLSESVYNEATVAAVGVAAHEVGHAIQHAHGYSPMKVRSAIIPVTKFGSMFAFPLIFIGFLLNSLGLIYIGIILFATVAAFQLVTLPVEFNASRRAVVALDGNAMLNADELKGSKKVLTAAALTYVAALAVSLAQLLNFILRARR